jgi:hypothetical protein
MHVTPLPFSYTKAWLFFPVLLAAVMLPRPSYTNDAFIVLKTTLLLKRLLASIALLCHSMGVGDSN